MRRLYGGNWTEKLNTDALRTQLFPSIGNGSYREAHLPPQGGRKTRSFTDTLEISTHERSTALPRLCNREARYFILNRSADKATYLANDINGMSKPTQRWELRCTLSLWDTGILGCMQMDFGKESPTLNAEPQG